jgi:hypothetical protein
MILDITPARAGVSHYRTKIPTSNATPCNIPSIIIYRDLVNVEIHLIAADGKPLPAFVCPFPHSFVGPSRNCSQNGHDLGVAADIACPKGFLGAVAPERTLAVVGLVPKML